MNRAPTTSRGADCRLGASTPGKRYQVPIYQRSYSWTETEWDDLWRDIVSDDAASAANYMGALVLRRDENDEDLYEVIDGQQRLATFTVVIAALLRELESWGTAEHNERDNAQRLELLRERFLAHRDAASLSRESRLNLSRADDSFFQSAIVSGHEPAAPSRLRNGAKALWKARQYFAEIAHKKFGPAKDGAVLARFIEDRIARRLTFIRIVVGDEAAAYTVFETLNARGVALGTADLLRESRSGEGVYWWRRGLGRDDASLGSTHRTRAARVAGRPCPSSCEHARA